MIEVFRGHMGFTDENTNVSEKQVKWKNPAAKNNKKFQKLSPSRMYGMAPCLCKIKKGRKDTHSMCL